MNIKEIKCSSCGVDLDYNEELSISSMMCPYCGKKVIINDEVTKFSRYLKAFEGMNEQDKNAIYAIIILILMFIMIIMILIVSIIVI